MLLTPGWLLVAAPQSAPPPLRPLCSAAVTPDLLLDEQLWRSPTGKRGDASILLRAIDQSLVYLRTSAAVKAYQRYPVPGISRERVVRSLKHFRQLLRTAKTPTALARQVQQAFRLYAAQGTDGQGRVEFTAYFEPTYTASPVRTATFRYPLYRRPPDLERWPKPHPTRLELEGIDGLGAAQGPLRGLELVWLGDRLEAYLIQVQGSARLRLTNGKTLTVGLAGKTDYAYVSLGKELVKDSKLSADNLTLPQVIQYFQRHPEDLNRYLPRNNRFIFFKDTQGSAATGTLGVPLSPERSIATDKALMPPGALALIQTRIPYALGQQEIVLSTVSRYVLDQDTGGAIQGPGRVDLFLGTGAVAKARAGLVNAPGQLFYILLKDPASRECRPHNAGRV